MESKKIYTVVSYGGEWEDKWEHVECAFTTQEAADAYIEEQEKLGSSISSEMFEEINSYLAEKEYEIQCKYYDPTTAQLYKDAKEEDYDAESEEFEKLTKYELIKEKFNVEKEDYDKKVNNMVSDFVGYMTSEIDLFVAD